MKTKRNIAICGLTLVMCVSLLAGVTFAWFTDSITNSGNTISSGDLKINAYAYDLGEGGESYTINETVYSFEADENRQNLKEDNKAVITEENWYPGQSSAKMFTVENVGSLDADVSLDFFVSGGLTEALWFDFIQVGADGNVMGQFVERPMETLPALAEALGDVELASGESISFVLIYGMEKEAQNQYMNQSFQVNVFISAKQTVEGAEGPVVVNPGTDLSEVVNSVADNSTIVLAANGEYEVKDAIDLSGKKGIVIDGNGATITMGTEVSGASYSLAKAAALADTLADNSGEESILNISGAENVIIRNLTVEGAVKHGINLYKSADVLIENVVAKDNGALGICVNASEVTLKNVTTSGNAWGGVNVDNKVGEVTLTVDEACSFGEYLQIYADSEEIGLAINVNLPEKYTAVKLSIPVGEFVAERYLWTTDAVVSNATELSTAVAAGGNVIFANDIETSGSIASAKDVHINLNGYTWFNKYAFTNGVTGGAAMTITNGKIVNESSHSANANFTVEKDSTLTMSYIDATSNRSFIVVDGAPNAHLIVDSCVINSSDSTAISTNASTSYSCKIEIYNSEIACNSTEKDVYPMDNCPVYINVDGELIIDNCVITGQRQGVMVRAGTANITNTTIINKAEFKTLNMYLDGTWGSGNEVPMAALVVGNRHTKSYQYAANVTLENCELISNNEEVPAIYIWGNATEANGATLTFDKATYDKMQGNIDGVLKSTETSKVQINAPEGIFIVSTAEELKAALEATGTSTVVLGNDIAVPVVRETTSELEVLIKIPFSAKKTLELNGKVISLTNEEIIDYSTWNPVIFSVIGTLTVNGNGVVDTEVGEKGAYGIDVAGGTVTINGGTYTAAPTAIQVTNGQLNIAGGTFKFAESYAAAPEAINNAWMMVNCVDASFDFHDANGYFNGRAGVKIYGGTFVGFNPETDGEGRGQSYLRQNCIVEESGTDGNFTVYTVVSTI